MGLFIGDEEITLPDPNKIKDDGERFAVMIQGVCKIFNLCEKAETRDMLCVAVNRMAILAGWVANNSEHLPKEIASPLNFAIIKLIDKTFDKIHELNNQMAQVIVSAMEKHKKGEMNGSEGGVRED